MNKVTEYNLVMWERDDTERMGFEFKREFDAEWNGCPVLYPYLLGKYLELRWVEFVREN